MKKKEFNDTALTYILYFFSSPGRPKGECDVDFTSHQDAEEAMKKDKQNMGKRVIYWPEKSEIYRAEQSEIYGPEKSRIYRAE